MGLNYHYFHITGVSHQSNSRGFIPIIIRLSVISIGGMSSFPQLLGTLDLDTHDSSMDDVRSQVLMGTVRRLLADATGHDSRLPGLGMGRSSCNKDEEEGKVFL